MVEHTLGKGEVKSSILFTGFVCLQFRAVAVVVGFARLAETEKIEIGVNYLTFLSKSR